MGGVGLGERRDQGGARAGTVLRGEEETNGGIREDGRAEVQARKAERIANQQEFQKQRMDSQNQLQKEIMELAAQHGALTPEVIQEMLKQQTAQKAIDSNEEKD